MSLFPALFQLRGTGSTAFAAALLLAAVPVSGPFCASALEAQFGIGLRAGFVGIGADMGVAVGDRITLRAGGGALPFSTEQTLGRHRRFKGAFKGGGKVGRGIWASKLPKSRR